VLTFFYEIHAAGGENVFIMVGMFVCLCIASQKPSERVFFVPARMDLGVKLLSCQRQVAWELIRVITAKNLALCHHT
jgi:hypothetical protein